jgi:hypothetical protein
VEAISGEEGAGEGVDDAVLHALYRVGLLGYVQHDLVRGEWRQRFLRPGDATLDPNGALPRSTHYLIHPILSGVIARLNPAFLQRIDRANIVGYDRPWQETESSDREASARPLCVLKADVHGFGSMMRAGVDAPVRKALEEAVTRWAPVTGHHRDRRRRRGADRRRRSRGARAGGTTLHGRCLQGARAASLANRPALRRSPDASARHRDADDHRRRRCNPVRGPRGTDCRTGSDLGDRSVPRAVSAAAFVVADDAGARADG